MTGVLEFPAVGDVLYFRTDGARAVVTATWRAIGKVRVVVDGAELMGWVPIADLHPPCAWS
jgi:hypothetical protein